MAEPGGPPGIVAAMKVAGIDGCRDGWVAITLDDGSVEAAHVFSDMTDAVDAYRRKHDLVVQGLSDLYELVVPGGAFYVFPKAPQGSGTEFVARAIDNNLLVIPGQIFSRRDTHFRISYAADDETIQRGIEILRKLAR